MSKHRVGNNWIVLQAWVRGETDSKKLEGGGEEGLDWCMTKTGVRYTRILDPVHVLSARGRKGGGGERIRRSTVEEAY